MTSTWSTTRRLLHVDLHWLDVTDRVKFKLGLTVHRCLSNKAPHYLADRYARIQHRQSAAPTFSSTSPSGCTTTQPQHTWPSVIFCRRSYRLEFASGRAPRSRLYINHFQTVAEDIFLRSIITDSALDMLVTMRYTN